MNFDYGNVLTRSFQIAWKHKSFWLFSMLPMIVGIFIFAALVAPVFFLDGSNDEMTALVFAVWVIVMILGIVVSLLVGTAGSASLLLGIRRAERGEGSTAFLDLLRDGLAYFWRTLGVILIVQLTLGLVFTIFFLFVGLLSFVTMGLATICLQPVMILLTPLSFLVIAVMDGALMAVIDENLGAWDAVKRALQVVREHVWKFIILTIIVYFGSTILSSIFVAPAMIPVMAVPIFMETEISGQMVILALILFSCIFFPLMTLFSGVIGTLMNSVLGLTYLRLVRPAVEEGIFASEEPKNATS
ncbi:MAG: hypothetical protein JNK32_12250 [Anaerolineales bacterium]|nr:hypothetical protein [Anaerolineales bacterium]